MPAFNEVVNNCCMNTSFEDYLLEMTKASSCQEVEVIQSLWSGYGKISRYKLEGITTDTVVVKYIALNQTNAHPRGWNTSNSHNRKIKSYEIETHWYQAWNHQCDNNCRTPAFLGAWAEGKDQWIVLEDLNSNFPLRKYELDLSEIKACLAWLANFHGTFLNSNPLGLWEIGTYWHLDTRPDEWEEMNHQELKAKASEIDQLLNQCTYKTIVHGDAKVANFCFSEDGQSVAAVDFQYVGGGCGMKDVAYFLGSCLSGDACALYEKELLDFYFFTLKNKLIGTTIDVDALEEEWRLMYPVACVDFTRFLLGWMPTHQKINGYNLAMVEEILEKL